ncbi:MAG: thioredoxin-disulfide reductase [Thermodesulfobacteriota bacterium]|nr:thioredoxin-disulfide reductase [Thermodesulfobacteriota bacterium]
MSDILWDVIIIGGGPAGLTAGIYTSRANMKVLLIESAFRPSLITTTDMVENFPGFPDGVSGLEIIDRFSGQAEKFGMQRVQKDLSSIRTGKADSFEGWEIEAGDETFHALSVIIATGAEHSMLDVKGEKELGGRGVSYCATCDGPFYRDGELVVVGGGDTAIQEALFLTKFARNVTIVHRRDRFRATGILADRAINNERISIEWNAFVEEILGENEVTGVRIGYVNNESKTSNISADGVFIFTGYIPNTGPFKEIVSLDNRGYIQADCDMRTSALGVFACGDCIHKKLRQVITACGDGATAAFSAQEYVDELKGHSYD